MIFHNLDYSTQSFLPSETNTNVNQLLKSSNSELTKDFIFTKVLEFKNIISNLLLFCYNKSLLEKL